MRAQFHSLFGLFDVRNDAANATNHLVSCFINMSRPRPGPKFKVHTNCSAYYNIQTATLLNQELFTVLQIYSIASFPEVLLHCLHHTLAPWTLLLRHSLLSIASPPDSYSRQLLRQTATPPDTFSRYLNTPPDCRLSDEIQMLKPRGGEAPLEVMDPSRVRSDCSYKLEVGFPIHNLPREPMFIQIGQHYRYIPQCSYPTQKVLNLKICLSQEKGPTGLFVKLEDHLLAYFQISHINCFYQTLSQTLVGI